MKAIEDPPEGSDPMDAEALKLDIEKNMEKVEELQRRIPEAVKVSIFNVIIKDIRNNYCSRYQ